ncbi:hypothetical protein E4U42_000554 [Claviceps africana]|uniref:HCNGP-like protein n=1 Tax=Claviceps africana TaxID=83212 RepID=A0A8K0NJM9_9HYPO|nr:hypothetical protein E4U42_000554 [Claviceps africana]
MAGLVAYASSDDEDDTAPQISPSKTSRAQAQAQAQSTIGPIPLGPSLPPPDANTNTLPEPLPSPSPSPSNEDAAATNPPSSPYSSTRALMHDLTLPSVPNLAIPSSPPGSPPPATNKKFQQFLHLKRKGTHFNTRLESSMALRNPSLTDKLLSFVDLAGPAQYETTLPRDLYDPGRLPRYAHRDRLRKAREALVKEREAEKVSARGVDFVHPSTTSTPVNGGAAAAATRGIPSRGAEKRKSAWK